MTERRATWLALLSAALLTAAGVAHADAKAGRDKSRPCAACHGPLGLSTLPNAPNLAGQPEIYLSEQLKAYRNGKRSNEIMTVIAKPLSDDDIADLAAWYGSLVIEVKDKP